MWGILALLFLKLASAAPLLTQKAQARRIRRDQCDSLVWKAKVVPKCHIGIKSLASSPHLRGPQDNALMNDLYALSEAQMNAHYLFNVCSNGSPEWKAQRATYLLSQSTSLAEFLAEEDERRLSWVTRAVRFVWSNYARYAYGAPEMDPRTHSVAWGEWLGGEPMFILDNLDSLWMTGFREAVWDLARWIEVYAVLEEAAKGQSYYLDFRRAYVANSSATVFPQSPAECDIQLIRTYFEHVTRARDIFDIDEAEHRLGAYIDACLPAWDVVAAAEDPEARNLDIDRPVMSTVRLLRALRHHPDSLPSFDAHGPEVSFFELTIRAFGGLLSAFTLTGHPVLLYRAWDVGHRLSYNLFSCHFQERVNHTCVYDGVSTAPCLIRRSVGMHDWSRGNTKEPKRLSTTAAVIGTNQMEFRALSDLTGICDYVQMSDKTLYEVLESARMQMTGLMPVNILQSKKDLHFGNYYSLGAEADSFYEYLVKGWFQSNSTDNLRFSVSSAFAEVVRSFVQRVAVVNDTGHLSMTSKVPHPADQDHWSDSGILRLGEDGHPPLVTLQDLHIYAQANQTKVHPTSAHTHLGCFAGGLLFQLSQLAKHRSRQLLETAEALTEGCAAMYLGSPLGLAAETYIVEPGMMRVDQPRSLLRPETLESLVWGHHVTHKLKYRNLGAHIFDAIMSNGRVEFGLCSIDDSTMSYPTYYDCRQDTWILAESLKYLYLLMAPEELIHKRSLSPVYEPEVLRRKSRAAVRHMRPASNLTCPKSPKELGQFLTPFDRGMRIDPYENSIRTRSHNVTFDEHPSVAEYLDLEFSFIKEQLGGEPRREIFSYPFVLNTEAHPFHIDDKHFNCSLASLAHPSSFGDV